MYLALNQENGDQYPGSLPLWGSSIKVMQEAFNLQNTDQYRGALPNTPP